MPASPALIGVICTSHPCTIANVKHELTKASGILMSTQLQPARAGLSYIK